MRECIAQEGKDVIVKIGAVIMNIWGLCDIIDGDLNLTRLDDHEHVGQNGALIFET